MSLAGRPSLVSMVVAAALLTAAVVGAWARFADLGSRPLAVDEYYTAQSVRFVLERGVPEFPTGGIYLRGVTVQYIMAAAATVFGFSELALRLPSVLFGLGTALLVFFYARRFMAPAPAAAVCAAVLLSSWEIEFSRFARMYSIFQFATIAQLLAIHVSFAGPRWWRPYVPVLLIPFSFLSHQLGILLVPLLMIPLIPNPGERIELSQRTWRYFGGCLFVGSLMFLLGELPLRSWKVSDRFPADHVSADGPGTFRVPNFPSWSVSELSGLNLVAVLAAVALAAGVGALLVRRRGEALPTALAAGALAAALAHSLTVFGILAFLLVFRYRVPWTRGAARLLLAAGAAVAALWLFAAIAFPATVGWAPGPGPSRLEMIRRAFFGWPDYYLPVVNPWLRDMPVVAIGIGAGVAYHVFHLARRPWREILFHPVGVCAYIATCFAILDSQYIEIRYSYFLYPVLLVAAVAAAESAARKLVRSPSAALLGAGVFLAWFGVSEDFDPRHIAEVASREVSFRAGRYDGKASVWYGRADYRSAGTRACELVADTAGSRLVLMGQPPVSFYSECPHAVYYDRLDSRYDNVSREHGTVDVWSNERLLSTEGDLREYTGNASAVFIVTGPKGKLAIDLENVFPSSVWDHGVDEVGAPGTLTIHSLRRRLSG